MLDNTLSLGAYEKSAILELDSRLTLREAHVFQHTEGARMLNSVITMSWELGKTIPECVHILLAVRLLLFRGSVPTPDAIAAALSKLKPE